MKDFLSTTYTFTPGASGVGTVALNISNFDVKRLVAIINQTRGEVIYSTGSTALRYTSISNNVLTLNYATTGHVSNDILQVIYNDANPLSAAIDDVSNWLKSIFKAIQSPSYLDKTVNAIRATITTLPTLANVTTVGSITTLPTLANVTTVATLTGQTNIGIYNAEVQTRAITRNSFFTSVRSRIS
jgi:hypothetical protein